MFEKLSQIILQVLVKSVSNSKRTKVYSNHDSYRILFIVTMGYRLYKSHDFVLNPFPATVKRLSDCEFALLIHAI